MKSENPRPGFSWMPFVSRPAILTLAATADLNILAFANYQGTEILPILAKLAAQPDLPNLIPNFVNLAPEILIPILEEFKEGPHIARFTGLVILAQLNLEVLDMILNRFRHKLETEKANADGEAHGRAQGIAQGIAEGEARANAKALAWFEKYQQDPSTAPPPPFQHSNNANGKNPDQGYTL